MPLGREVEHELHVTSAVANVICTDDDEAFKSPKTASQAANFWVVVIDYHH